MSTSNDAWRNKRTKPPDARDSSTITVNPVVSVENVTFAYGEKLAVEDISLSVEKGDFLGLIGPNGSGKTTLLHLMLGLRRPDSGSVELFGEPAQAFEDGERIGYVAQRSTDRGGTMPITVREAVTMGRFAHVGHSRLRESDYEIVDDALRTVEITDLADRRINQLSGGQRQRVAIGRAIVREPAAFLFDEPLSNLDAALRVGMRLEISELHNRLKTTMIYVTHDQVEAMTMADKIVVLRAGHIEQVGSPLELYKAPRNLFVAGFIGSPRMNLIGGAEAAKHKATTIGIRPEHIHISADEGAWSGVVGVSEHLGSDTFFHVQDTGLAETVTVRADGEVNFRHGDRIYLTPREERLHRFDEQGLRIA